MSGTERHVPALLAVLLSAMIGTVIAGDMVNLVLPDIGADFGADEAETTWVVTGFMLSFSVGIPFYGRIADRVGLRRLFCLALLAFAAGSLLSALAPNLPVLVLGRIVTGAGAAAIPVLSIVAVTLLMPADRRGFGIGVVSAGSGIGTAVGPAVGGGVGEALGWPALFWLTLVLTLALLPAAMRVLPSGPPAGGSPFDLAGGILLGLGSGLLLFGVTQAQTAGASSPTSWCSLLAAAAALALFGRRTVRSPRPFVPPALFTDRVYRTAVAVAFLAMTGYLGGMVFVPLLLIDVNGLGPGAGALVMIPAGVVAAAVAPLTGRLADAVGTRPLVLAGLAVVALSSLHLSTFTGGTSVLPAGIGILGLSVGFMLVMNAVITAAATALPGDRVGVGVGILQGAQFLGAGAGPALFGVLLTARRETGAVNPLFGGPDGTAYSDVFLTMAALALLTLPIAWHLRPTPARPGAVPSPRPDKVR